MTILVKGSLIMADDGDLRLRRMEMAWDLANRIIQTILNEKMMKKFSKNSKKLAKEHDVEKTIDHLEKIYRELM